MDIATNGPVIVLGASGALGSSVVLDLFHNSSRPILCVGRRPLGDFASENDWANIVDDRVFYFQTQDGDPDSAARACANCAEQFGSRAWGFVDLSGMSFGGLIDKASTSSIASILESNLLNPMLYTSAFLNSVQDDDGGRVILASSILATRGQSGVAPYSSTKGGVESFALAAAHDAARRRVTVNAIRLGYFDVGMIENVSTDVRKQVIQATPVRRLGCAEDLTRTVEFLLEPASSFITGATIPLTGGL